MEYRVMVEDGFSDFYFSTHCIDPFVDFHVHSHIEFLFLQKGNVSLFIDGKKYPMTEGHLAVILPYEAHRYETTQAVDCYLVACPPEYIPECKQILRSQYFAPPVVPYGDDVRGLVTALQKSLGSDRNAIESGRNGTMKKKALLYCSLHELLQSSTLCQRSSPEPDLYREAILYLSHHFTQNLELSTVAKNLGVSASHLGHILSSKSGLGFSELINSLRAYEARRLLQETDRPISQIAFDSGFGSIRNFNRVMQRFFHCLPKALRSNRP